MSSDEMIADEENLSNSHDASMYDVIKEFTNKSEQSFDDFYSTFTYLKTGDITSVKPTSKIGVPVGSTFKTSPVVVSEKQQEPVAMSADDTGDIEEEVLGDGVRTSVMASSILTDSNKSMRLPMKFDNFLEPEIDEDSEESENRKKLSDLKEDVGYIASFASDAEGYEQLKPGDSQTAVITGETTTQGSTSYNHNMNSKTTKSEWHLSTSDSPDFKTSVLHKTESDEGMTSRIDTIYPGEIEETDVNPPSVETLCHVRCLQFMSNQKGQSPPTGHRVNCLESQVSNNEVEAFSLDENFDYDSVVLTPKFSAEEMVYLQSFRTTEK